MKLKVEGHPGLIRDNGSKAIISEDRSAYQNYINEKNFRANVGNVKQEVDELKQDMAEIKSLLQQLINSKV